MGANTFFVRIYDTRPKSLAEVQHKRYYTNTNKQQGQSVGNTITNTNIIDMNGKRYDAIMGTYLGDSLPMPARNSSVHHVRASHRRSIDGFIQTNNITGSLEPLKPLPRSQYPVHSETRSAHRNAHQPGINVAPHRPQRATTLMRSAVSKPVIKSPAVIKAQTRTDLLATVPQQTVAPKLSVTHIDPVRHRRAERMIQSPAISRFADTSASSSQVKYAINMPAQPVTRPRPQLVGQDFISPTQPRRISDTRPPVSHASHRPAVHTAGRPVAHSMTASSAAHHDDIFEKALAEAKSHEQTYEGARGKVRRRRHILRYVTGSLIAVFLLGFLAYHNAPNLSMQVASYKAGLHAKFPAQQPLGFTFGYLDYQPGNVTINFTSPDSRQFHITQKASSWDSQALLSNFVASANSAYKTYQQAGRTVYLLGNNTATWVDSGVWYTVDGNSSLSSKQLLELASSM